MNKLETIANGNNINAFKELLNYDNFKNLTDLEARVLGDAVSTVYYKAEDENTEGEFYFDMIEMASCLGCMSVNQKKNFECPGEIIINGENRFIKIKNGDIIKVDDYVLSNSKDMNKFVFDTITTKNFIPSDDETIRKVLTYIKDAYLYDGMC